ncbi:MAG: 16S rRNA (adenine(1518)-N(6)/adenine(1519)-N(6))-dimethyltransferase RsmA [Planctomycetota bacterium]|nr:16S rRNA (adenine(1518)-N(6)/adenine(1519)-N(6))-dimethyltransferase RsmA [Planctomycetota bacterium]
MTKERQSAGLIGRLRAAGIVPRRSLGQNFLHDPRLLASLVEEAGVSGEDTVFEVGTGPGTLTGAIADRVGRVLSVEIDSRLVDFARRELSGRQNVEILQGDVLAGKSRLAPAVEERLRALGPVTWIANLPYSIATPVILAFLEAGLAWRRCVLTVQLEVAERLASEPGGRSYGASSALLRFWASARLVRRIGPGTFWPRPRVDSAVVRLDPRQPPEDSRRFAGYRAWVKYLFARRRKQLGGLLRQRLGRPAAERALELGGWGGTRRPESLEVTDFLLLAENFPLSS